VLQALFALEGRLGRLAYFGYSLLLGLVLAVLAFLLLLPVHNPQNNVNALIAVFAVVGVIGTWCSISLGVKRLHDLNLSGWHYAWMALVPAAMEAVGKVTNELAISAVAGLISLLIGLYLLFWPGTDGPNDFGEAP